MKLNEKIFYIFLGVNAIIWTFVGYLKNSAGVDALEAISWGELISFGTNKHPPLSGWLMGGFYNLLGQNEIAIYILGQICIVIGLIFVYKLAKNFLEEEKAFCSSLIVSISFYYTYQTFIDNFNCNIISICLWPILVYYFYLATKENKIKDWLLTGVFAGLSILAKYQVAFLFLPMFLYLLVCKREQFAKVGIYLAGIVALAIIAPHIFWLSNNDFFSFNYIMGRTNVDTGNTPLSLAKFGHLIFPIKFYGDQLLALLPCFLVYAILAFKEKNISFNINKENISDKLFLLFIGLLPIIVLGAMGFITGNRVVGNWGSTMVGFSGILLFYFFPIKFNQDTFKTFIKIMSAFIVLWAVAIIIFLQFQTKMVVGYPHQTITADFDKIWANETNNSKLKYVNGDSFYIFQFHVYGKQKPTVILETYGHKNPWIDYEDVKKSGVLIISENTYGLQQRVWWLKDILPKNYQFESSKYTFKITNILNKSEEYEIYYTIIPPEKN